MRQDTAAFLAVFYQAVRTHGVPEVLEYLTISMGHKRQSVRRVAGVANQSEHQTRLGAGRDHIGYEMRLVEGLPNLFCDFGGMAMMPLSRDGLNLLD